MAADLCVLNTCTVTGEGDAKSRQLVRRLHRANPEAELVVATPTRSHDVDDRNYLLQGIAPVQSKSAPRAGKPAEPDEPAGAGDPKAAAPTAAGNAKGEVK